MKATDGGKGHGVSLVDGDAQWADALADGLKDANATQGGPTASTPSGAPQAHDYHDPIPTISDPCARQPSLATTDRFARARRIGHGSRANDRVMPAR